jgi:hypothetical protein
VITTVPISLFLAIATGVPVNDLAEISLPLLSNCNKTGTGVLGFQVRRPGIAPAETNVTHEFVPVATNAVDRDKYRVFQVGLLNAEYLVIAASVLFEYLTIPPCSNPVPIEFQLRDVFLSTARATTCSLPVADTFNVMASLLVTALDFKSRSLLRPTTVKLPSEFGIASVS